jgi:hypothetical protein
MQSPQATQKELIKRAALEIRQRLLAMGFRRETSRIFSIPVTENVIGWVGLNQAVRWGFEINPVVGARHQQIERIVAECTESPFDPIVPPTVAANIGYLAPQHRYMPFLFAEADVLTQVADQLAAAVRLHGIPFMKKCADLNFIVEFMQAGKALNSSTEYRIPIGLHLLHRDSEALRYLEKRLDQIVDHTSAYAVYYRRFAANSKSLLNI